MFGISNQELLIILLVVLVLFGGKRIPEAARGIGSGMREVRKAIRDVQREVDLEALIRSPAEKGSAERSAPEKGAAEAAEGARPSRDQEKARPPRVGDGGEGI